MNLTSAKVAIRSNTVREYVAAELARVVSEGLSEDAAISVLHDELEDFANSDPTTACSLMAVLRPLAGDRCLHEVCDATDLYIQEFMNPDLIWFIHWLIETEKDLDAGRSFTRWTQPPYTQKDA